MVGRSQDSYRPLSSPRLGLPNSPSPHTSQRPFSGRDGPIEPSPPTSYAQRRHSIIQSPADSLAAEEESPRSSPVRCHSCGCSCPQSPITGHGKRIRPVSTSTNIDAGVKEQNPTPRSSTGIFQKVKDGLGIKFCRPSIQSSISGAEDNIKHATSSSNQPKQHKTRSSDKRYGVQYDAVVDHWTD